MKDLVLAGLPLELYDENGLHFRPLTGGRARVDSVNRHAFREKIELTHSRKLEERLDRKVFFVMPDYHATSREPSADVKTPLLEVCVETLPEAIQAVAAGAGRLEVCASMVESGTTPSIGLVSAILERVNVPALVMIRPRGGDFTYDDHELDVMQRDIEAVKRAGAHGIVSGVLEHGGVINKEATQALIEAAAPLPFTFHRAFDLAPELEFALACLRAIGVRRVLTSGGASSAIVGAGAIAKLARQTGNDVTLIAGGGVRASHVAELIQASGVTEVHARPTRRRAGSAFARRDVQFGSTVPVPDRTELDPEAVRALARELQRGA